MKKFFPTQVKLTLMKISRKINSYCLFAIFILYFLLFCIITKNTFKPQITCSNQELLEHDSLDYFNYNIHTTGEEFDFKTDTLALLHIQKTSGTSWETHILQHLEINRDNTWEAACVLNKRQKRNVCTFNNYKKSIFWDRYIERFCDIHADYTELKNCVMREYNNRIALPYFGSSFFGIAHFMTFLRDPVHRYISEFEHVKKGATWFKAVRTCNDQPLYSQKCYTNDSWKGVTWEQFLSCEHNLANNRQVRMLANYNILGCNVLKCWTSSSNCTPKLKNIYEQKLLQSAKHTLMGLSFFGLTEYQKLTEYLFLKTFDENKFRFKESNNDLNDTNAAIAMKGEAGRFIENITQNNHLDVELYDFAKDLFFKRVSFFQNGK
jgi:heparan sulfate 6-O-sulfotransferase HS6ST1